MAPEKPPPSPLEETKHVGEGDEAPLNKGDVQPLNPGEKAEAATERLTTEYIARAEVIDEGGQKTMTRAAKDGEKAGLKISLPS